MGRDGTGPGLEDEAGVRGWDVCRGMERDKSRGKGLYGDTGTGWGRGRRIDWGQRDGGKGKERWSYLFR